MILTFWLSETDLEIYRRMWQEIKTEIGYYDDAVRFVGISKWCMTEFNGNDRKSRLSIRSARKIRKAFNSITTKG